MSTNTRKMSFLLIPLTTFALLIIFGLVVFLSLSSDVQAQETQVQRWEYKTLVVDGIMEGPFGAISEFSEEFDDLGDGVRVLENGVPAVLDRLNALGQEGWELISFTHNYGERGAILVFKRPVN